ncbi:Argininosuccinate synthase [Metarhizium robertsii ARSEF 23]|uniref:argininosuccinate synthase n=1 Tax=Metarhizium robertsii (strain ARSEF 23 / ATCC MYA-3075) TaxID=655844 RepID=E9EMI2_METRA|nr:Argininosuccinate synthase [Metarhizium robertsii ARSEF 23]EFZ03615.1 Argininosuccinate synthase [Metarhizium robertsii ARSEF 23]
MSDNKRVCLAYSGGLDTSVILRYLRLEGYTVVAYLGNVGQDEDWAAVEKKALALGAERMVIEDLQQEFLEELVFRGIQCNAIYEDRYLLGTSLARPVLARALVRTAQKYKCQILSHGCTGKGNEYVLAKTMALGQRQSCWSGAVLAFGQGPQLACASNDGVSAFAVAAVGLTFAANNDDLPGSASLPSLKVSGTHTAPGFLNSIKCQVRFELAWRALDPTMSIIAPWRMPKFFNRFQGRQDLLKFAAENNIPVSSSPKSPWSLDANLAHTSAESGILEKPEMVAPKDVWTKSVDPLDAPDVPTKFSVTFKAGIPVKLDVEGGETYTNSVALFKKLNEIAGANGVGRQDLVESRYFTIPAATISPPPPKTRTCTDNIASFIGLKSRGCYDAPAHTVLRLAHVDLEGMTVDSKVRGIMSWIGNEWSQCLYNGMYFSPERELLENSIIYSQKHVNGTVNMMVYKGAAHVLSRSAPDSNLYSEEQASMDTLEGFSPEDTSGFIAIQAIRLEKYGAAKIQHGEPLV